MTCWTSFVILLRLIFPGCNRHHLNQPLDPIAALPKMGLPSLGFMGSRSSGSATPQGKDKEDIEIQEPDRDQPSQLKYQRSEKGTGAAKESGSGSGAPRTGKRAAVEGGRATEDIIDALVDLALETKADTRELKGLMEWTVFCPGNLHFVLEGLAEGREFAKQAQRRKGENLGQSQIKIAMRTLQAMGTTSALADEKDFLTCLKTFWEQVVMKHAEEELPFFIQMWRVSKPKKASKEYFEGGYAKLQFRFSPATQSYLSSAHAEALQAALLQMAKVMNWQIKVGTSPRS